jgi:hypothetical protein
LEGAGPITFCDEVEAIGVGITTTGNRGLDGAAGGDRGGAGMEDLRLDLVLAMMDI